jgi:hypothetical protein
MTGEEFIIERRPGTEIIFDPTCISPDGVPFPWSISMRLPNCKSFGVGCYQTKEELIAKAISWIDEDRDIADVENYIKRRSGVKI